METLPHVLNHCMVHATIYKKSHDALVGRVRKLAIARWSVKGEDQVMGSGNLRPYLVFKKNKDVLISDITITFENGLEAFAEARKRKEEKYEDFASELRDAGFKAKVEAVIAGFLGSWDCGNDGLLKKLCSPKYLKVMRKIMVSKTIAYSRDVFYEHLNNVPQDSSGWQW